MAVVLGASALLGRRNAPDPSHPAIRRWYARLHKPGFTPPDAAFGAVWPVLETGLAAGILFTLNPAGERGGVTMKGCVA
ncbi:tryptophan-rich sensory protein, partial [Sphingomonas bacterium]|uniref:tryptophan-rich sensory protein n=1 Tax=Sphingomonas bacterium TaxID=1895847 RepID=UPI0020C684D0